MTGMNPTQMERAFPVLIDQHALQRRIGAMAEELARDLPLRDTVFVAVLEGARIFAQALLGRLPGRPGFATVRVSSYGSGTVSSGKVQLVQDLETPVAGKTVVLIEDIVDTGRTVQFLAEHFRKGGAREVRVVTLLSKPSRRVVQAALDLVGFEIPDQFVIGFGMDADGKYRELPHIAVFE
jgi:hypoxanthine phosphoribosyltransferase